MYYHNKERNELLQRLETKNEEELRILFDILDRYTNSRDCYMRGSELNDEPCTDEYEADEMYYGTFPNGELEFEVFTGVWDEDGDTGQYLVDDKYLPYIVEEFEKKTNRHAE